MAEASMQGAAQAQARLEVLQRRIGALDTRSQALQEALIEIEQARAALDALDDDASAPALVPLGGGVHAHADVHAGKHVVVPIGSGYAVGEDLPSATQRLEDRSAKLRKDTEAVHDEVERLVHEARGLQATLMQAQQQGAGGQSAKHA